MTFYLFGIEFIGPPFDNPEGSLRAFPDARTQSVAEGILDQPGFPIHYPNRSFGAGVGTLSASIAALFIDFHNFPSDFHGTSPCTRQ
jgi:hypothetical protein